MFSLKTWTTNRVFLTLLCVSSASPASNSAIACPFSVVDKSLWVSCGWLTRARLAKSGTQRETLCRKDEQDFARNGSCRLKKRLAVLQLDRRLDSYRSGGGGSRSQPAGFLEVRFRRFPVSIFFQRYKQKNMLVSVGVHRQGEPQKHNQAVEQSCVVFAAPVLVALGHRYPCCL